MNVLRRNGRERDDRYDDGVDSAVNDVYRNLLLLIMHHKSISTW